MSLFDKDELLAFTKEHTTTEEKALNRKEFLVWLHDFSTSLKEEIRDHGSLLPKEERETRFAKGKEDFDYFRRTYFPHYFSIAGTSSLQDDLSTIYFKIRDKAGTKTQGEKFANAAPRGFGKSTDVSLVFPIWCICYNLKHFITIFSDAIELTETLIEAIKAELEENIQLSADFPHATGITNKWKIGDFVSKNNIRIKGYGSGKKVRGVKHGTYRPDLTIIDDLENDENVRSRKQRDKLEDWLDSAIDNLGSVESLLDIVYIGTILHRDSVLARKLKLGFWSPKVYRAIERYPVNMDLWDTYATLYRRDGLEEAKAYYLANKSQMDAGAILLWDGVQLEHLMQKRAANKRAFDKEQQNRPNEDNTLFDSATFKVISPTQAPSHYDMLIAYTDFKGDAKLGDYSTVVGAGLVRSERKLYVFLSHRERVKGKKAVEMLLKLQKKHHFDLIGGETNGGFFLYKEWYKEMCIEKGIEEGNLKFKAMTINKEVRIATLEYPLDEADIIFVGEHKELFSELDDFPESEFDDMSDGLAGLYRVSRLAKRKGKKRTRFNAKKQNFRRVNR